MTFLDASSPGSSSFVQHAFPLLLTTHAGVRAQQRGVDRSVLACLLQYGKHEHDHMGCEVVTFDDGILDEVARRESRALSIRVAAARSLYAVVDSNGKVVTTGHRFRRVLRDRSLSSNRPGRSRRPEILHARSIRNRFP